MACLARHKTTYKSAVWTAWQSDLLAFAPFSPHQEAVGQHHQKGVTVEALPQPALVLR